MKNAKPPAVIDAAKLVAEREHHPGPSRDARSFSAPRLPESFQTVVDPTKHPLQPYRDLPKPTGGPPFRLQLAGILSAAAIQRIEQKGRMVFHSVGDTGGVNTPTYIEQVASYMESDFGNADPSLRPSFYYHLGDVVYYDGEAPNYYPEFYEPYNTYPAPIFAIPGNHDGDINPQLGGTSLEAFVRNFCAVRPAHSPDAGDSRRDTMTQPNVHWTLETPLATIIGLYSNCPEGGEIRAPQIHWLIEELKAAPKGKALILTVHHPLYSAYGAHPGSQHLQGVLDQACAEAGRVPHLVLSGHVHNYQRFTGTIGGRPVPCLIAGAGGYNARLHVLANIFHTAKLPLRMKGSGGVLESFCDSQHGYLRITVTAQQIQCDYIAVPNPGGSARRPRLIKPFDTVRVRV